MSLLHELLTSADPGPFALLRRHDREDIEVLRGSLRTVARLADLPLPDGPGWHALALVPYRQLAERGFACVDDGTPLTCLDIESCESVPLTEALTQLPAQAPPSTDLGFDIDDDEYREIVARVLRDEIGAGEGSNFVIHRTALAQAHADPRTVAGAALRRLLLEETGCYWTFLVHLPDTAESPVAGRTLVGATPERHVSVDQGLVMMNPISGTFRHGPDGPDRAELLRFLADPKETNELSMVLDEELKMMAVVADHGGQVLGPYLKQMSRLSHTEYLLAGRTGMDVREVLRETMFAPTLTGSPIENATRVIERYEGRGREYYGGVLALLGRDSAGGQSLDAPILFRCADIAPDGRLRVKVGATLVRDSTPDGEVAETHAKAAGVLTALGLRNTATAAPSTPAGELPTDSEAGLIKPPAGGLTADSAFSTPKAPVGQLAGDSAVNAVLAARNERLAGFWLSERAPVEPSGALRGRSALIVDAEDTFTGMLAHLLRAQGMTVEVRRTDELVARGPYDLVIAGPGPGDPQDDDDPRVRVLDQVIARRLADKQPLLAVCLGHQVLSRRLGLRLHRRRQPYQGLPRDIDLFGTVRRVGYYATFTALAEADTVATPYGPVELARELTGEVHALRGPGFAGVQFHPESVLTEHGPTVLADLIEPMLPATVH